MKKIELQVKNNVNIPSEKINKIVKKMIIEKVEDEEDYPLREYFPKKYDRVVKITIQAGVEGNTVDYLISQRENLLYDLITGATINLNSKSLSKSKKDLT